MSIEFKKNLAILGEVVTVEEAEALLDFLQKKPTGKIHLGHCEHLHPSSLQVLMAAKATIHTRPKNLRLKQWVESALRA